jgi:hypothetical protein
MAGILDVGRLAHLTATPAFFAEAPAAGGVGNAWRRI